MSQKIETFIRINGTSGSFVDSSNAPGVGVQPNITLGMAADLVLHFFDGESATQMTAAEFGGVTLGWLLSLETDYNQATAPKLITSTVSVGADGTVTATIPSVLGTALQNAIGTNASLTMMAELAGYATGDTTNAVFVAQFPIVLHNRSYLAAGSVLSGDGIAEDAEELAHVLTDAQMQALNSQITITKVGQYDAHLADSTCHVTTSQTSAWNAKQNAITSANKLSYDLLSGVPGTLTFTSGGSTVATYGSGTTSDVTIPLPSVGSGGTVIVDSDLSSSSTNPVQNKVVYSALSSKQDVIDSGHPLPYSHISGAPSGSLIITSGGSTVVTFSNGQSSDTSLELPSAGSGGGINAVVYNGASVTVSGGTATITGAAVSGSSSYIPSGPVVYNDATKTASQTFVTSGGSAYKSYSWYCGTSRRILNATPARDDFTGGGGVVSHNKVIYFPQYLTDGFPMEKKEDGTQTLSSATGTYYKTTLESGPSGGEQTAYTNGTYYIARAGDPGAEFWRLFRNDGSDALPSWTMLISGTSNDGTLFASSAYIDFSDATYGTFRLYSFDVVSFDFPDINDITARQVMKYLESAGIKYDPGLLSLMTAYCLFQHIGSGGSGGSSAQTPSPQTYYSVSSASVSAANGDYYLDSGTHGTVSAIYTNGAYYLYHDSGFDMWGINSSTEPSNGGNPAMYWTYYNETTGLATAPTGSYNGATVSAP